MFGFLRAHRSDIRYRQLYAGFCGFQHRHFGIESLPLLSYEGLFLYLLAVDALACPGPHHSAVTCCRWRRSGRRLHAVDDRLAMFCSCFGLLLASIKLEDDVRDEGSLLARLALLRLGSRIERAKEYLETSEPRFAEQVGDCVELHLLLERADADPPLQEYAGPTAKAFGFVFGVFAELLAVEAASTFLLREIGSDIGRALICFDCAVDWRRDRDSGRFNPVKGQERADAALLASQQFLSRASWRCRDVFGADALTRAVISATFERVQRYVLRSARQQQSHALHRRRKATSRRGECDCPCDTACCDATCCECCHCPDADVCFLTPWDCCLDCGSRRSSRKVGDAAEKSAASRIGKSGRTLGPLNPSGVVLIGDDRVPARSESGWIDTDAEVQVVKEEAFGIVVRSVKPAAPRS